jgi:predicted PhzF superfamily epimerase YddE/YHI9
MKTHQIVYQVDAFTTEAFKGNPAGVNGFSELMSDVFWS